MVAHRAGTQRTEPARSPERAPRPRRTVECMAAAPEVRNDTDKQQYSLIEDGEVIGLAAYEIDGDEIRFVHTEVDPEHRGGGHASVLVQHALDDVRATSSRRVVAQCSYVHAWIERHPDYQELTTR
ncbi:GNAT family N-acetyltransferase [Curtobacterium sp. MCLR17_031]|nr:GNAT family N-acetyltransferase [Curtobacterium sp. MCLR17_031]WIE59866.1 GNAT family N-acetyltransferase [Curtobacterium sp. MCLR17_031]